MTGGNTGAKIQGAVQVYPSTRTPAGMLYYLTLNSASRPGVHAEREGQYAGCQAVRYSCGVFGFQRTGGSQEELAQVFVERSYGTN